MVKKSTRVCFIFNPAADRNRSARHIEWLKNEAKERWIHFEIDITQKNQDVAELARSKATEFDIIVACGGDGTINNVVNGIAGTGVALGVLPIGSGNDFVKTARLDKTLPECLELIYQGETTPIDLIRIEGDREVWCANTTGIGLDGLANYYARSYRKLKGHIVYVLGALRAAFNFRGTYLKLVIDGTEYSSEYLMITVCNGKWEGGSFFVAPKADMMDGKIDLLTIDKISIPRVLSYLPRFRWGPSEHMRGVTQQQCKCVEFWSDVPLSVHNDGEFLGSDISHLKLTVHEKILEVVTPADY
ncbi:MAG: diacylglycerol kinase family lipid kinase [Balneolaceae bacterium]|nr:MAG: diacylglycerol kinase family lipid kinase [Balneolaceae bacterium]